MTPVAILLTIVIYFAILLAVSRFTARKHTDNDAFFRGNRRSPWYLVAFGMVGASLSGVTFVSVPGMVTSINMNYMQTCLGFFFGYIVIAEILLPLYYKLNLTSIYTYLDERFGNRSYKTGASFFILSKLTGAAARLFIVCVLLQQFVFDSLGVPFEFTVTLILLLIWLYTRQSGIRTIVWTDTLQTLCLLTALGLIFYNTIHSLDLTFGEMVQTIKSSPMSEIFVFDDWVSRQNFFKQFFSGMFITIVMTGLDQDMMQKNLTCRNLKEAKRNMYTYGFAFIPVNFIFLCLGILLVTLLPSTGLPMDLGGDNLLPAMAAGGFIGKTSLIIFTIGIISAAFSSADSAMTALTTSFTIDILDINRWKEAKRERIRKVVHFCFTLVFIILIILLKNVGNNSIIDTIYVLCGYTYGPLLGLFAFGLFTKRTPVDKWIPLIAIISPILCYAIDTLTLHYTGYKFGYELLMLNGLFTFIGLLLLSDQNESPKEM